MWSTLIHMYMKIGIFILGGLMEVWNWIFLLFFLMFVSIFIFNFFLGGRGRENPRQAPCTSTEPDAGLDLTNHEIMT